MISCDSQLSQGLLEWVRCEKNESNVVTLYFDNIFVPRPTASLGTSLTDLKTLVLPHL